MGEIAGQPLTHSQHPRTGVSVNFAGLNITITDQPSDVFKPKLGFIQRIENAAAAIPEGTRQAQIAIPERQRSTDQAQANVGKPFKHAEQLADAIAHKARIETQLNPDQQSPQSASISAHLAAAEAALQGPGQCAQQPRSATCCGPPRRDPNRLTRGRYSAEYSAPRPAEASQLANGPTCNTPASSP